MAVNVSMWASFRAPLLWLSLILGTAALLLSLMLSMVGTVALMALTNWFCVSMSRGALLATLRAETIFCSAASPCLLAMKRAFCEALSSQAGSTLLAVSARRVALAASILVQERTWS